MATLLENVRYSLRVLVRRPGLTLTLLTTLGLGIGATTMVFTILDTVVLRPLPFPRPDELVSVWATNQIKGLDHERVSPVDLHDIRAMDHVFEGVAAWWRPQLNLTDDFGEPVRVEVVDVTDNFFEVLQLDVLLGRGFRPGEDRAGADPVLVISYDLWHERYGADSGIIGKSIELDGRPFTVIGVAPSRFSFPDKTSIWRPLGWDLAVHSRVARFMEAVARLDPGVSVERAQLEVASLAKRLETEFPETNESWGVRLISLQEDLIGPYRFGLWLLFGATGVLLLITCANIANLKLIQTTSRELEVAVRTAVGADRRKIWLQLATESILQALVGGALGLIIAVGGIKWIAHAAPFELPRLSQLEVNGRVLAFAFLVALFTAVLFGLAPAWRITRIRVSEALKASGSAHTAGRPGRRARRLLVICEIFLATMLATSAGLLVRSFLQILDESPGIDPRGVLTANIQLPMGKYSDWDKVWQFYQQLLERIEAHPNVSQAAVTNYLPLDPAWQMPLFLPEQPRPHPGEELTAQFRIIGPEYFSATGIAVLRGRSFDRRDDSRALAAVVVNQEAAKLLWPEGDAVGRKIATPIRAMGPLGQSLLPTDTYEVIGVVTNAKNNTLLKRAEPTVYFTFLQFPYRSMYLIVKGQGNSYRLAEVIRSELSSLDPTLALAEVRDMDQVLASSVAPRRLSALVMSTFAFLALLIAVVGIYGVLSYDVTRRRHEIGIRMVLGAHHRDILYLIGRDGLKLTIAGLVLGITGSVIVTQLLSSFLYQVQTNDWMTFAIVVIVVVLGALWASWIPALRAASVDPAYSMRYD